MLYRALRFFLFRLDPERAHGVTQKLLQFCCRGRVAHYYRKRVPDSPRTVMGIQFRNPVGLAAGMDRHGEYTQAFANLGFGFVEVGTVTPKPQAGNPLPRLFRITERESVINRMGFYSKGLEYFLEHVKRPEGDVVLGINIGKNSKTPNQNAIDDYLTCMRGVYLHADYITINISSPNTVGLRELQEHSYLHDLLRALKAQQAELAKRYQRNVPLVVKVAPDLMHDDIKQMADAFLEHKIDGVIATNTSIDREGVAGCQYAEETGGLSGRAITPKSLEVVREFHKILGDDIPIIGLGGIMSGADAKAMIDAGASLVQLYTGLIYRGPVLVREVAECLT